MGNLRMLDLCTLCINDRESCVCLVKAVKASTVVGCPQNDVDRSKIIACPGFEELNTGGEK